MRQQSRKRTTAAVLRSILEIKDSEMAALLGCSVNTIWSVESGRLALSESLAMRMAHETGIGLAWLLAGDPTAPPVNNAGRPFDRQFHELHAAGRRNFDNVSPADFAMKFLMSAVRLRAVLESANKANNYHMAAYKAMRAIDALAREFCPGESSISFEKGIIAILNDYDTAREAFAPKKPTTATDRPAADKPEAVKKRAVGKVRADKKRVTRKKTGTLKS